TTTIQFSLPQSEMVSIIVYDINGKEITTLINDNLSVGYHSVTWNSKHSSGLYFIRMESGGYVESKKVMLLK
ncbi:MAG TPA: T9SS type A sorting domain-containing protein, partial [Candidatus Marinimicrobia bacterium]|nr:T9SS type A sorting domain-containing protein [Candidatus Neomarinimicrobiota bacterium]